jgi:hypothetical protein
MVSWGWRYCRDVDVVVLYMCIFLCQCGEGIWCTTVADVEGDIVVPNVNNASSPTEFANLALLRMGVSGHIKCTTAPQARNDKCYVFLHFAHIRNVIGSSGGFRF